MTDLLNCPFCGSESVSQDSTPCTDEADYIWFKCDGCGVESEGEHGRDAALAQWNRRPHAPVSRPGDGVEGESVAIMRPFWVSWWGEPGTFELHRPWWVSGERDDGKKSICAAVLAQDEFTARLSVQWAHDDKDAVIEWRFAEERPKGWSPFGSRFRQADWMIWPESLTPAEPAEARIRSLEAELEDAKTVDSGLWDWLCERDLQPDGVEFEWSDVVVALTEHETNAYDLAEKAEARATAAEAKLARAVEGLERIVHWRVEMTGTPVDTEAANAWALTFDAAATEASQTLAALQQEGE